MNNRNKKHRERKYAEFSSDSPIAEAYRVLRTNIEFSSSVNAIKTVLITSSLLGEGKSTTTSNLGKIFALGGTKTLIIDLDLRRPVVHKILSIEDGNERGITSIFLEDKDVEDLIVETDVENLYAIPCGKQPINPAELLSSEKLEQAIAKLREMFDLIIFDSPPAVALADAGIISRFADATMLVVSAGDVTYSDVETSTTNLKNAGANILGIIMNNITRKTRGYKYYKYDYYGYR